MNKNRSKTIYIIVVLTILLFVALAFTALQVRAQENSASDIEERLIQRGIPVIYVSTESQLPYKIEIGLQSSSNDDRLTLDDVWYMILAGREAKLAYRHGPRVNSYKLVAYNTSGNAISGGETFIHPDDNSQQLPATRETVVDNETAELIVLDSLKPGELSIDILEVLSEGTSNNEGQILMIEVSAPDTDAYNRSIRTFMGSLMRTLDTINSTYGAYIVLCRLDVSYQGQTFITFARDLETGNTRGRGIDIGVEGLDEDWWPYSSGPVIPTTKTPTPFETPTLTEPVRPGGQTQTPSPPPGPYPPPPSTPYP